MHYLYRYFDATDRLLYVGITNNLESRDTGHRLKDSHSLNHWYRFIARKSVEEHPSECEAKKAETKAIKCEQPIYNITKNGQRHWGALEVDKHLLTMRRLETGWYTDIEIAICLICSPETVRQHAGTARKRSGHPFTYDWNFNFYEMRPWIEAL